MSWHDAVTAYLQAKIADRSRTYLGRMERRHPEYRDYPITTPENYRSEFSAWNSLALDLVQARTIAEEELGGKISGHPALSFGLSTGTTGNPGVFITNKQDRARWLGTFVARAVPLSLLMHGSAAILLRSDSRMYHQTGGKTHFLSLKSSIGDIAQSLLALKPDIVVSPPVALRRIAQSEEFQRKGTKWAPKLIITGGEPLWDDTKKILEDSFNAPVRQVYQATEGFFASSCAHGRLHLNTDTVRFEKLVLRQAPHRYVPVVTDLVRSGPQKIIRYRTDDIAIDGDGKCPCCSGRPVLSMIEGRLQDVLVLPSGAQLFPKDIHDALSPLSEGALFRITQLSLREFSLEVQENAHSGISRRLSERLDAQISSYEGTPVEIATRALDYKNISEKFRLSARLFKVDESEFFHPSQAPITLSSSARNAS